MFSFLNSLFDHVYHCIIQNCSETSIQLLSPGDGTWLMVSCSLMIGDQFTIVKKPIRLAKLVDTKKIMVIKSIAYFSSCRFHGKDVTEPKPHFVGGCGYFCFFVLVVPCRLLFVGEVMPPAHQPMWPPKV